MTPKTLLVSLVLFTEELNLTRHVDDFPLIRLQGVESQPSTNNSSSLPLK
jgi:hypothetical protein